MKKAQKKDKHTQEHLQQTVIEIVHDFFLNNWKIIGLVVVLIVAVAAAWGGWKNYQKQRAEDALLLESEAMELYETVISAQTRADDAGEPADEAETEDEPTYEDVLALYQQILDQHAGTNSAERALFFSGSLEYHQGHYDAARQHFETYITQYPRGELVAQAKESLAYVYEQQGEYQRALEQLQSIDHPNLSASKQSQIRLAIGRNYENLQQKEKAIETYQHILDSNTSGSWKNMARERLDILQPPTATAPEATADEAEAATTDTETAAEIAPQPTPAEAEATPADAEETANNDDGE